MAEAAGVDVRLAAARHDRRHRRMITWVPIRCQEAITRLWDRIARRAVGNVARLAVIGRRLEVGRVVSVGPERRLVGDLRVRTRRTYENYGECTCRLSDRSQSCHVHPRLICPAEDK
jgi:hypothetical protein